MPNDVLKILKVLVRCAINSGEVGTGALSDKERETLIKWLEPEPQRTKEENYEICRALYEPCEYGP
jgi:MoaA/NifB/PqqE/SkfB family radical SAM enzyme